MRVLPAVNQTQLHEHTGETLLLTEQPPSQHLLVEKNITVI